MTARQLCDEHGALCQTLGRIEGKVDSLVTGQAEQWIKINDLLAKDSFRNGQSKAAKDSWARWLSVLSLLIAVAALGLKIWRG